MTEPSIYNYSNLIINNGTTIQNNNTTGYVGGIYQLKGTTTMNGGNIINNTGTRTGAIRIIDGSLIMNGGNISNNSSLEAKYAGAIAFRAGNFEVHGGTVYNNIGGESEDGSNYDNIVELQSAPITIKDFTINPTFVHNANKYHIINAIDNSKGVSIDNDDGTAATNNKNVWLYTIDNARTSDWGIGLESIIDGKTYYKFYNLGFSNKCLDVQSNATADKTNVRTYICNSTDGQRFYLEPAGDDYYYIKHKTSNKCLDVAGGSSANRTNIQIYTCNNTSAQKWKFVADT